MATLAHPDEPRRPNIASADIQLPAVTSYEQVDDEILAILKPTKAWFGALLLALACLGLGAFSWIYQIHQGLGVAGYNPPVMWGVYIITFVFWVGIGHAGTLISAVLYLFRAGTEEVQDRGDERARVADADPEHEGDDIDAPHHRRVVAGDAEPLMDLVDPGEGAEAEAGEREEQRAEPSLGGLQDREDLVVDLLVAGDGGELDVRRRDVRAARLVGVREGGHGSRLLMPWPTPSAPDG